MFRLKRLIVAAAIFVAGSTNLYAQQPVDIKISVDFKKDQLMVEVYHPVRLKTDDYVRLMEVYVDDSREPIKRGFRFQRGGYQRATFLITDLEKVEKVVIRAYPTHGAYLEKEFEMNEYKNEDKPIQDES